MSESRETSLWDKIHEDVKARSKWEERLPVWYRMRHTGIPRRSKPYPGAPDLHMPIADTTVEKLKPFYYKQLFAAEHIAELTSEVEQMEEWTEHATRRFDYELKLKTNLLTELWYVIDAMLANGLAFMRQSWNPEEQRIEHLAIEPRFIIVPPGTEDINKAFRFVHVEVLTRDQYRERKRYNQDADFLKTICGSGVASAGSGTSDAEREKREGITQASSRDQIVVWNTWERTGAVWTLKTLSAVKKGADIAPPLKNPFAHAALPYVDFRRELKEKGIYSSRGEIEKVAPFEVYACRVWNKKAEALDHYATPIYTSDNESQDGKSATFHPGSFVPRGVRRVDMGQPPFALDAEIDRTRAIAEQRTVMPDFGIGDGGEKRTATEIEQIAAQGGITTEARAHIFRLPLQRVLKQDFGLFLQYRKSALDYLHDKRPAKAPKEALHERYLVDVGGTSESWNKKLEAQKVATLFTNLKGDGYVDQKELRTMLVEKTDPRWVRRLVRDPQEQANTEAVDEMVKLPAVMEGAPIPVEPQENHQVRAEVVWQKLQQLGAGGMPADPIAQQALTQRLNQRLAVWMQMDGKTARNWWRQKQAEMKAQQQAAEQAAAGNVLPFSGGASTGAGQMPQAAFGGAL
jgi:hypothetical protein